MDRSAGSLTRTGLATTEKSHVFSRRIFTGVQSNEIGPTRRGEGVEN